MSAKTVTFVCIQALLANAIYAQCLGALGRGLSSGGFFGGNGKGLPGSGIGLAGSGIGLAANALGMGAPLNAAAVHNSGGFTVTSSSPIAPSGVSLVSEYVIEGPLNVGGNLPILSAVTVDAQLPSSGSAGTSYSCGNGNVGIVSDGIVGDAAAANAANAAAVNAAVVNSASIANGCNNVY